MTSPTPTPTPDPNRPKDADQAAVDKGDHSLDEMGDIVGRYGHDEEVANGFYNQLGGRGTRDFVKTKALMYGEPKVWHALLERLSAIVVQFLRANAAACCV